jgi:hypothetical protein
MEELLEADGRESMVSMVGRACSRVERCRSDGPERANGLLGAREAGDGDEVVSDRSDRESWRLREKAILTVF